MEILNRFNEQDFKHYLINEKRKIEDRLHTQESINITVNILILDIFGTLLFAIGDLTIKQIDKIGENTDKEPIEEFIEWWLYNYNVEVKILVFVLVIIVVAITLVAEVKINKERMLKAHFYDDIITIIEGYKVNGRT